MSTNNLTPERKTPNKKSLTLIRKIFKNIKGLNYLTSNNQIHMTKNHLMIHNQVEHHIKNLEKLIKFLLTITNNNNEASSSDFVHQHNDTLSSDVVQHSVYRRKR